MDPVTLALIVGGTKAVGSGVKYLTNRSFNKNRPKFGSSAYGKYLSKISKQGIYSPKARGEIVNRATGRASEVGERGKKDYAGRLTALGMEGSVAGQEGANRFDANTQRVAAETAREITLKNEASKVRAEGEFAERKYADALRGHKLRRENVNQLVSGMTDAATSGFSAYVGAGGGGNTIASLQTSDGAWDFDKINKAMRNMTPEEAQQFQQGLMATDPDLVDYFFPD